MWLLGESHAMELLLCYCYQHAWVASSMLLLGDGLPPYILVRACIICTYTSHTHTQCKSHLQHVIVLFHRIAQRHKDCSISWQILILNTISQKLLLKYHINGYALHIIVTRGCTLFTNFMNPHPIIHANGNVEGAQRNEVGFYTDFQFQWKFLNAQKSQYIATCIAAGMSYCTANLLPHCC